MLHIGCDTLVRDEDILMILDLTGGRTDNAPFLSGLPCRLGRDRNKPPRSAVVCAGRDGSRAVYYSPISTATLLKRGGSGLKEALSARR